MRRDLLNGGGDLELGDGPVDAPSDVPREGLRERLPRLAGAVALLSVVVTSAAVGQSPEGDERAPALDVPSALPMDSAEYGPSGLQVGVLLQVRGDFPRQDDPPSTFFLRKAEVALKGRIDDHTHFSVELDPVNPDDPFRRTYIRLSHLGRLHLKLGMEKAPLGLDELHSTASIPFVDRSEVNDRFAAAEELGAHLESRWTDWLFQLSVTNGGRRLLRDNNEDKDVSARAVWAPVAWVSVGVAALEGRAGAERLERSRYNVELKLGSEESGLQGEFYEAEDGEVQSSAYYLSLFRAFPLDGEWLTHLQPAVRYERVNRRDDLLAEELDLLTFGVNLLFDGHRSKLQANYLMDLRSELNEDELRVQYQVEL